MSGLRSYLAGHAAEETVARLYQRQGYTLVAQCWRGGGGEIDLIFDKDGSLIFTEVKKSKTCEAAALRLSTAQIGRITRAAATYLAKSPDGQDTDCRFDVALVGNAGAVEVIENAFGA